jgi:hypothetical protein
VHLEVRVDNPARRLYHRLGFRRSAPFLNGWWRYEDDGSRVRVEEMSLAWSGAWTHARLPESRLPLIAHADRSTRRVLTA